jgi:L,D-peptidoglycan transpeptidase YkuD (ErfK/YbiS/YcfS/YnhG family)
VAIAATLALALAGCGRGGADDTSPSVDVAGAVQAPSALAPAVIDTSSSAMATTAAVRVDPPLTDCQRVAAAIASRHPAAQQLLVVRTAATTATTAVVQLAERAGPVWVCGDEMTGRVGRSGVRPLLDRRSGDGTTPAGVFPLGSMTAWDGQVFSFFGNAADPGVSAGPYRRVRTGDCFGATPNTAGYGHLRDQPNCPGPDDEYLPRFTGAYVHAALIGANTEPDVSGDAPGETAYASAIFLHRDSYTASGASKPTSGCVSLAMDDLVGVLRAMHPDVLFAIGTTDWLLSAA